MGSLGDAFVGGFNAMTNFHDTMDRADTRRQAREIQAEEQQLRREYRAGEDLFGLAMEFGKNKFGQFDQALFDKNMEDPANRLAFVHAVAVKNPSTRDLMSEGFTEGSYAGKRGNKRVPVSVRPGFAEDEDGNVYGDPGSVTLEFAHVGKDGKEISRGPQTKDGVPYSKGGKIETIPWSDISNRVKGFMATRSPSYQAAMKQAGELETSRSLGAMIERGDGGGSAVAPQAPAPQGGGLMGPPNVQEPLPPIQVPMERHGQSAQTAPAPATPPAVGTPTVATDNPSALREQAIDRVLKREGGFVSNDGNGTPTNFGINQAANPDVDVKSLTPDRAREIYRQRYWSAIGGDNLPPALAEVAFDTAVNFGPSKANKLLAESGGDFRKLVQLRQAEYERLATQDPKRHGQNLRGWTARNTELLQTAAGLERAQTTNRQDPADLSFARATMDVGGSDDPEEAAAVTSSLGNAIVAAPSSADQVPGLGRYNQPPATPAPAATSATTTPAAPSAAVAQQLTTTANQALSGASEQTVRSGLDGLAEKQNSRGAPRFSEDEKTALAYLFMNKRLTPEQYSDMLTTGRMVNRFKTFAIGENGTGVLDQKTGGVNIIGGGGQSIKAQKEQREQAKARDTVFEHMLDTHAGVAKRGASQSDLALRQELGPALRNGAAAWNLDPLDSQSRALLEDSMVLRGNDRGKYSWTGGVDSAAKLEPYIAATALGVPRTYTGGALQLMHQNFYSHLNAGAGLDQSGKKGESLMGTDAARKAVYVLRAMGVSMNQPDRMREEATKMGALIKQYGAQQFAAAGTQNIIEALKLVRLQ